MPMMANLKAVIGGSTHPGLVREINEDSYAFSQSPAFAIIADGLAGHAAGEIASKIAVEFVAQELIPAGTGLELVDEKNIAEYPTRLVAKVNNRVFELSWKKTVNCEGWGQQSISSFS
jgi:serine/threonine protein phosphatase PrpC